LAQVELHLLEQREMQVQILFLTHTLLQVAVVVRERLHCQQQVAQVVVVVASQEPLDQVLLETLQAHHLLREILVETEMIMVQVLFLLAVVVAVLVQQGSQHQQCRLVESVGWAQPTQSQDQVLPVQAVVAVVLIKMAEQERLEQADQALVVMEDATD
jgi:hypothetical protein